MPANFPEREPLERSSTYLGFKLLWITRLFLIGKKFPRNQVLSKEIWEPAVHDILDLVTQPDFMKTMTEIDCQIFF